MDIIYLMKLIALVQLADYVVFVTLYTRRETLNRLERLKMNGLILSREILNSL